MQYMLQLGLLLLRIALPPAAPAKHAPNRHFMDLLLKSVQPVLQLKLLLPLPLLLLGSPWLLLP
jgi:hypothetical protein